MNLLQLRRMKGISKNVLSLRSGISLSKISLIEKGYPVVTSNEMCILGNALEVDVNDIDWSLYGPHGVMPLAGFENG